MKRIRPDNINESSKWQNLYERQGATRRTTWNNRELTKDLSAVIPQHATVLDVGAGPGLAQRVLINREGRSDIKWTGMDFAPYAAEWALKESGVGFVDYFTADIRKGIPAEDNSYDVVMSTEVLEHLDDQAAAVAEFARVARRRIIVTTPLTLGPRELATKDSSPYHVWAIWPEDLENLLGAYGAAWSKITRTNRQILCVCDLRKQ